MLSIIWTILTWIFRISLGYYVCWLLLGVISAIFGIDSGFAAPALGNGKKDYGLDGFKDGITAGLLLTLMGGWVVIAYQILYLIIWAVLKIIG